LIARERLTGRVKIGGYGVVLNGPLGKETNASRKIYFKLLYSKAFKRVKKFLEMVGSAWEMNVTKMREHIYLHA
jgi:hypothetical protein